MERAGYPWITPYRHLVWKRGGLLLCGIVLSVLAWHGALALPLSTVLERAQQRYAETKTLQAEFQQTSLIKSVGEEQQARGIVYIQKPGRMRWEYRSGENQILVTNGETLWFYFPEEHQVIQERLDRVFQSRAPALFLAGEGKLEELFTVQAVEGADSPTLRLLPKTPHPMLQELVVRFDPQTWDVVESQTRDFLGNVTTIRFHNIRVNVPLSPALFHFQIPPGTEVITPSEAFPRR
ncbi:MAG: outer membrane lipoprotein carrier protein LolA [Nitrospinota bacterium]|nr:MAG: outer membrane lipoprotein carrier protein LolA [Nitrospinota bacterium]